MSTHLLKFYVTSGDKVLHWGKLSQCADYICKMPLDQMDYNIVLKDNLTTQQKDYLNNLSEDLNTQI